MNEQLRAALRAEAARHEPDREAMLDRITTATVSGQRVRSAPRARMTLAAAVVAALLGGGGVGTWALTSSAGREAEPTAGPIVTTAAPSPVDTAPVSVAPAPSPSSSSPPPSPSPSKVPPPPPTTTAVGEVDGDSSVVTLTTTEQVTSLEVTIRVKRTDGLESRSGVKKVPGASVTSTVTEEPDTFVYRFVMSESDTLAPGTYTFTARYRQLSGKRDTGGDSFHVTAGDLRFSGDFG